ncbi:hypothetical protein EVAR_88181_1 [Eumeta japonica]|uniref:Uncharacterized protein n=1 Tax=Eumeta variegata TaxID=151549 RepID=A0A4C1WCU9_EUMVA|nr:hypothetical protein EVAR_88181_1 [Eumeta japonica]
MGGRQHAGRLDGRRSSVANLCPIHTYRPALTHRAVCILDRFAFVILLIEREYTTLPPLGRGLHGLLTNPGPLLAGQIQTTSMRLRAAHLARARDY